MMPRVGPARPLAATGARVAREPTQPRVESFQRRALHCPRASPPSQRRYCSRTLGSPLLASSYGRSYARFELLGATGALALLIIAGGELRRRAGRPWAELAARRASALDLPALPLPGERVLPEAVRLRLLRVRRPRDPAGRESVSARPDLPLPSPHGASLRAGPRRRRARREAARPGARARGASGALVFYFYQCAQLALILLAYQLGVRFARGVGLATTLGPLARRRAAPVRSTRCSAPCGTARSISGSSTSPCSGSCWRSALRC